MAVSCPLNAYALWSHSSHSSPSVRSQRMEGCCGACKQPSSEECSLPMEGLICTLLAPLSGIFHLLLHVLTAAGVILWGVCYPNYETQMSTGVLCPLGSKWNCVPPYCIPSGSVLASTQSPWALGWSTAMFVCCPLAEESAQASSSEGINTSSRPGKQPLSTEGPHDAHDNACSKDSWASGPSLSCVLLLLLWLLSLLSYILVGTGLLFSLKFPIFCVSGLLSYNCSTRGNSSSPWLMKRVYYTEKCC